MSAENHLIGKAALSFGMTENQLRRACDAGVIDPPRVGRLRVFPADRMAEFRQKLRDAGRLPARPPAVAV